MKFEYLTMYNDLGICVVKARVVSKHPHTYYNTNNVTYQNN